MHAKSEISGKHASADIEQIVGIQNSFYSIPSREGSLGQKCNLGNMWIISKARRWEKSTSGMAMETRSRLSAGPLVLELQEKRRGHPQGQ